MDFLCSFLRRHFTGKLGVTSRTVGSFSQASVFLTILMSYNIMLVLLLRIFVVCYVGESPCFPSACWTNWTYLAHHHSDCFLSHSWKRSAILELFAELMLNLFLAGRLCVDLLVRLVTPSYRGNVQDCKIFF